MSDKEVYERVIRALLSRWKSILGGETVYKHTFDVEGITVTPLGDLLSFDGNGYQVLEQLLTRFRSISGLVAVGISSEAVKAELAKHPELKVPDALTKGESAAEAFLKTI